MADQVKPHMIEFEPSGRRITAGADETLLEAARRAGLALRSVCGGYGTCRGCRVRLLAGEGSAPTGNELERLSAGELAEGYRLACQCRPVTGLRVGIPEQTTDASRRITVDVPKPVAGGSTQRLGLAVDLGSTRLAAYLVCMADGQVLATADCLNPQIAYGEDIIARISFADRNPGGGQELHRVVLLAVDDLAAELCAAVGAEASRIESSVLAGNTVMGHLAAGMPVGGLGQAPFMPVRVDGFELSGVELGSQPLAQAKVYFPAIIAGYVGADHVSALLASRLTEADGPAMLVDIGTNTEISLWSRGQLYSCSCASGPAFEGGRISAGMRAGPGAISAVRLVDGQPVVDTIGDVDPVGICGSGILDAVAVMAAEGALDRRGVLRKDHDRVELRPGGGVYRLVEGERGIVVTRKDVNEIQLGKAAIRCGVEVLLRRAGIEANELARVDLAGAFGAHLSLPSAIGLGMLPDLPLERYHQIGNAAGDGAVFMLHSPSARAKAEHLARQSIYIELTSWPRFMDLFVENCRLPVRS
jgi:uncharacterized 2Fe-2S/4Fe-4S cluster protein (DUF4445 family)